MSHTYSTDVNTDELVGFLLSEYEKGTGIPVHLFSVVNASMPAYNRTFGITNGFGTLFVSDGRLTAYGYENQHGALITALKQCNVDIEFIW